ncbi:MAG: hypothetical protein UU51_C0006G0018 [Microgenomates group bacterium GW2011_GWC1_41_20]|uniref:Uncharacterized protein n=7 Tax=Candidatus Woeseibacteriota TaxID=1752722 RepID=A0A0G0U8S9_9BACT|nr:MAG: hypothetical protein UT76_C0005G0004 [Candidatus Woesebacteria bacterium GW2011_GWB1_40_12]KKR55890.1 MAG: hypothetical protein UT93_C0011G0004 [Candidatus Woesebacteria bacterium GW2011_GWF1_40_24]KKR89314.1 MAG: hypothetical protein UU39_C0043G0004 [Candidatus Woesebacteria bacterium GW2011_GWD1_41_12]KKS00495.1 MAG: hypothetical protein UU51_C0006G0018 [Microgenomates group bacterium GW2011_GWC1_41_20]KKS05637.1 MAG: hypothetical protein UU57_C0003G0028 [Candidatus Woesebacteria bact
MQSARKSVLPLVIGAFLVVLAGVVTAWMLSANVFGGSGNSGKGAPGVKVTSTEAGKLDPDVKYDAATGVLTEGGINGEGTYRLARNGGGSSKDVALTSSTIDLGEFLNKKVDIWGETISSTRPGGWLMDVAKIKVIE